MKSIGGRKFTAGGLTILAMAFLIYWIVVQLEKPLDFYWFVTLWIAIGVMLGTAGLYMWINYKQKQILPPEIEVPDLSALKLSLSNLQSFVETIDKKADRALVKNGIEGKK